MAIFTASSARTRATVAITPALVGVPEEQRVVRAGEVRFEPAHLRNPHETPAEARAQQLDRLVFGSRKRKLYGVGMNVAQIFGFKVKLEARLFQPAPARPEYARRRARTRANPRRAPGRYRDLSPF